MASPQLENGHVKIANEIIDELARLNLSKREWRVLWAVLRKTWGWRRKVDTIPNSQLAQLTGIERPHVVTAKRQLIEKNILFTVNGKIGFQKDYEQWQIKGYSSTNSGTKGSANSGTKVVPIQVAGSTNSGTKVVPIQGPSKATKATIQKQQRAEVSKSFREYWNSKTNLPAIVRMTPARKKKLAARMKEPDFADNWQVIIDRISASGFCTGGGDKGWLAGVDWLLGNSTNCVKVLEGKYDDSAPPRAVVPLERDGDGLTPRERALKRIGAI
ncbi:MAG: replication protein [Planctomycetota bacterium]